MVSRYYGMIGIQSESWGVPGWLLKLAPPAEEAKMEMDICCLN